MFGSVITRIAIGVPVAALITFVLFSVMRALIFVEAAPPKDAGLAVSIKLADEIKESDVITRKRRPNKPKDVKTPPPPPKIEAAKAEKPKEGLASVLGALPDINPDKIDRGSFKFVVGDRDAQPLVRLEPQYPPRAAERGVEGKCSVVFDVNPDGTPTNIRPTCDSSLFDDAVRRAVGRWKYQPKIVDGVAVMRRGVETDFEFKLEK